jgi:hypothetical protein
MASAQLIKRDGKVSIEPSLDFLCSKLTNGEYDLVIKRKTEPRTVSQNALMWMWFECISQETGTPKQDVHDYYCSLYLAKLITIGSRQVMVKGSTSSLTTAQMTKFLNLIQADAQSELGIQLPLPADRFYNEFIQEYRQV